MYELEDKLMGLDTNNVVNKAEDILPDLDTSVVENEFDFIELQKVVNDRAIKTIDNIVSRYFDLDRLDTKSRCFIETRMEMDVISLKSIIYQMETSDYAVGQILDQLNSGFTTRTPRMLETLSAMQKTNIDSIKTLTQTITIFDSQYAKMRENIEEEQEIESDVDSEDGMIARGTRDVIRELSDTEREIEFLNSKE